MLKKLTRTPAFQKLVGTLAAEYLRFVWKTSRVKMDPHDFYDLVRPDIPFIVTMWHGQHFMTPFFKREEHKVKVLISRHRDGEINSIAAERLEVYSIRGSGDHGKEFHRKGGVGAFREMLSALEEGHNMAITADIPKVSRVAGMGIVKLAQLSGRPIYCSAIATQRRIELNNWDRTAISLPFGRCGMAVRGPIRVAADADDDALERARKAVEDGLNEATARAYELADSRDAAARA